MVGLALNGWYSMILEGFSSKPSFDSAISTRQTSGCRGAFPCPPSPPPPVPDVLNAAAGTQ